MLINIINPPLVVKSFFGGPAEMFRRLLRMNGNRAMGGWKFIPGVYKELKQDNPDRFLLACQSKKR